MPSIEMTLEEHMEQACCGLPCKSHQDPTLKQAGNTWYLVQPVSQRVDEQNDCMGSHVGSVRCWEGAGFSSRPLTQRRPRGWPLPPPLPPASGAWYILAAAFSKGV